MFDHPQLVSQNNFPVGEEFFSFVSILSKMIIFWSDIILEIFFMNSIFGKVRHRDCSTASWLILFNLSIFFGLASFIIDLSLGRK
jgi:hypothetical protein